MLIYAAVVTVLFNVDTIVIARALWGQEAVQEAIVAQLQSQADASGVALTPEEQRDRLEEVSAGVADLQRLHLPMGWAPEKKDGERNPDPRRWPGLHVDLLWKLLGLGISVGALSLGAPFWFDVLNKISKLRDAGDRPSTSPSQPTAAPNQPVVVLQKAAPPD